MSMMSCEITFLAKGHWNLNVLSFQRTMKHTPFWFFFSPFGPLNIENQSHLRGDTKATWSPTVLGLGCQEKPQSPKPTIRTLFKTWCWMGKWETWELFKTCWDKEKTRYGFSDWNWSLGKRVCRGQWGKVSTDQGRLGTREHAWHLHSFYKQGLM